ncbi:hypothetical protein TIFTF001_010679 [Ficus carica]|uniref:Fe2OG dioxygenase domain-containing protein n=1 Tax=Ficus carica TaxID=3494 RepID=A0AA87ZS55_FICCA|nr:hypothetical protein TIFTF001_010679 [Ficus carica]
MSVLMGMDSNGLKRLHGDMKQYIMNYYPPCSRPDLVLGVSPHSEGGSLTVLLQDNDITGLQIKYKGSWIPVKPIPNALVVNMGDLAWSNVLYRSIEHRAVMNAKRTRMSIATFLFADDEAEIGPVESMTCDRRRIYRKVKHLDYIRHRLGRKMDGKANLYFLKLESESFG